MAGALGAVDGVGGFSGEGGGDGVILEGVVVVGSTYSRWFGSGFENQDLGIFIGISWMEAKPVCYNGRAR